MAWGLMVLGNAPFTKIVSALAPVQRRLAREVNAIVLPVANCVLIEALRLNSRNEGKDNNGCENENPRAHQKVMIS